METELTTKIKRGLRRFKPLYNSNMRTIRFAEEVWADTGIVDFVRFEDYVKRDESFCRLEHPFENQWDLLGKEPGKCKIPNERYPNNHCKGCVYKCTKHILDMAITCYEIKISVADFKSKKDQEIWGSTHALPNAVNLHAKEVNKKQVPSVIGMGAKDAVYLLESKGLRVHLSGVGSVHKQSIAQGTEIKSGQTISIELR